MRSTSASVETWRAAMTAQAITVFPDPGGATSTPRSCRARLVTAARWTLVRVAVNVNSCCVPGPFVGDVKAAAGLGGEAGDGVEHAAGQDEAAVEGLVVAVQEPGEIGRAHV